MDAQTPEAKTQPTPTEAPKPARPITRVPAIIVGVVVAVIASLSIWYLVRPVPLLVQGEVDATRFDIAARVDGRVAEIPVVRGQNVAASAVLVKIDNPETMRDVLKGVTARIPIYADATYLFLFRSLSSGITVAINSLSSELAAGGARTDGSLVKATLAGTSPADVLLQPIFNPVGGYASYIVPAAFLLILQQTLLIGGAFLTGVALTQGRGKAFTSVLGRGVAHLTIYLPTLALYVIVLPHIYGFSTLGDPLELLALGSVFLLATSFMAQSAGAWFKRTETPSLIFLATSLTQFFLTGFAWPREAIPQAALVVGYVFPVDFAINGIVRINQLGANLAEVAQSWYGLWFLAVVYFALAVFSAYVVKQQVSRP
jgi:ABC-2 type transport system permease protein